MFVIHLRKSRCLMFSVFDVESIEVHYRTNNNNPALWLQYNNDTEKCIQHLEQESQKSLVGGSADTNNHPQPANHNNNLNDSPGNNVNRNNSNHQPSVVGKLSSGSQASVGSGSQPSVGMSRYQELPVKHESTHISTVKHTVGPQPVPPTVPPAVPPKPLLPAPEMGSFAHPVMPPLQTRPVLLIDPANQGDLHPHTAPVRPHDFAPFIESAPRKQTDIPNIRCGPTVAGAGGASGGSPESRRPVKVINVHGLTSGGTVTSGPIMSPTSAYSSPRFRVMREDGGGLCSLHGSSAPVTPPSVNPYRFSGPAYVQPQPLAQETERPGMHSSSIYIDSAVNARRTDIQQESSGDYSMSAHPHQYMPVQYMDSQGPGSLPASRTTQPLSVSLSSIATPTPSERGQNVVYAGFAYTSGYNTGFSSAAPNFNNSGFLMSTVGGGGNRFVQEGPTPSPPRPSYPVAIATHGVNQLNISPGSGTVGPPPAVHTSSSPNRMGVGHPYGSMSPVLLPKSPSLQHQRSTGSSTSRSDSMDSEHGSINHPSDPACDPPHQPHPTHPSHHHRGVMGMGMVGIGVPVLSPASSQSSLSSESSARDRDPNSMPRQRSGSMQEEAAYSQGQ